MGTNFYAHTETGEVHHLGKRSAGWRFLFRAHPDQFDSLATLTGWLENTPADIRSEYGDKLNPIEFLTMARTWCRPEQAAAYGNPDGHRHGDTCWCGLDYTIHGPRDLPSMSSGWHVDEASDTDWCEREFC